MSQALLVNQKVEDGDQHMHLYVGGLRILRPPEISEKPLSAERSREIPIGSL